MDESLYADFKRDIGAKMAAAEDKMSHAPTNSMTWATYGESEARMASRL